MHLLLSTAQTIELRQEIEGGATLTVFPMSEKWLRRDSDHQNAVRKVKAKCKSERFESLMDYLFACVFPDCYFMVMDYYAEEGPPLREILTRGQCYMIDRLLIEALMLAHKDFCADRVRSWSKIREVSEPRYYRSVG